MKIIFIAYIVSLMAKLINDKRSEEVIEKIKKEACKNNINIVEVTTYRFNKNIIISLIPGLNWYLSKINYDLVNSQLSYISDYDFMANDIDEEKISEKEYFIGKIIENRPLNIWFSYDGIDFSIKEGSAKSFLELDSNIQKELLTELLYLWSHGYKKELCGSVNLDEIFTPGLIDNLEKIKKQENINMDEIEKEVIRVRKKKY